MKEEIKALIFDFDGVLMDNTLIAIEVFQEGARRLGVGVPSREDVIGLLGRPFEELVEKLLGEGDRCKKTHLSVWSEYEDKMSLVPELEEVLSGLKMQKAIVTSRPKDRTIRELKNLISYFSAIVAAEDVQNHKPHPEPLLKACSQLNVKPEEVVYIGDHMRDFEMARNAGAEFIGVLSGAISEEDFKKAGVKKLISSLDELGEIYRQSE